MSTILVDTNVLVSFLTDRDAAQQGQAAELLEAAARRELGAVLHQQTLSEMIYVLTNLYELPSAEVARIVRELLDLPGLSTCEGLRWTSVLELWPREVPDFADAVLVDVCRSERFDAIATFDRQLRRRLRPLNVASYWE